MAKVFISFLGTNDYLECSYRFQDDLIKNIRFVQEATIKLNCGNWSKNDKILIFTTKDAFKKNWKDNGQQDRTTGEYPDRRGLEKCLEDGQHSCLVKQIDIPDGRDEAQIWEIFSIIFDAINQNDEIIFDITHAFRSIPMLAMVILNYAKVIKEVSLEGLYYGAMEALGSFEDVKKISPEKRIIPIIDLTSFDQLMEWSTGIDLFLKSGNAALVSKLAEKSTRTILSRTKGRDKSQKTIKGFAKKLDEFTKILSTCRGRSITDVVIRLKSNLEDCQKLEFNNPLNKPLKPLIEKIYEQMDVFPEDPAKDGIQAAQWCLEHNLIQQGYTILQETLITYFVSMIGEDPENFENRNKNRTIAGQAVAIHSYKLPEKEWKKEASDEKNITYRFLDLYKKKIDLIKIYRNLTDFRNDINHCGFNNQDRPPKSFESKLKNFIKQVEKDIST